MASQFKEANSVTIGETNSINNSCKLVDPNCSNGTSDKRNNDVLIAADGTIKKID